METPWTSMRPRARASSPHPSSTRATRPDELLSAAEQRAAELVDEAEHTAESIRSAARDAGRDEGLAYAQRLLVEIQQARLRTLEGEALRRSVSELALAVTRRVLGDAWEADPSIWARAVLAAAEPLRRAAALSAPRGPGERGDGAPRPRGRGSRRRGRGRGGSDRWTRPAASPSPAAAAWMAGSRRCSPPSADRSASRSRGERASLLAAVRSVHPFRVTGPGGAGPRAPARGHAARRAGGRGGDDQGRAGAGAGRGRGVRGFPGAAASARKRRRPRRGRGGRLARRDSHRRGRSRARRSRARRAGPTHGRRPTAGRPRAVDGGPHLPGSVPPGAGGAAAPARHPCHRWPVHRGPRTAARALRRSGRGEVHPPRPDGPADPGRGDGGGAGGRAWPGAARVRRGRPGARRSEAERGGVRDVRRAGAGQAPRRVRRHRDRRVVPRAGRKRPLPPRLGHPPGTSAARGRARRRGAACAAGLPPVGVLDAPPASRADRQLGPRVLHRALHVSGGGRRPGGPRGRRGPRHPRRARGARPANRRARALAGSRRARLAFTRHAPGHHRRAPATGGALPGAARRVRAAARSILLGAYAPGTDPLTDEAIARQPALEAFLAQGRDEPAGSLLERMRQAVEG